MLHVFVLAVLSHVQPHKGVYVTKHRSSPLHRSASPSYLPIKTAKALLPFSPTIPTQNDVLGAPRRIRMGRGAWEALIETLGSKEEISRVMFPLMGGRGSS